MKIFKPNILILFLFAFLLNKTAHSQCSEFEIINLKKTAIVFGEALYKRNPLTNTVNDAVDITDSLRKIGFTVYTYQNSDLKTMNDKIDQWFNKIKDYDVALFYFSGHGAEVDGQNYLFPVDANPQKASDLAYVTYPANKILSRLSSSNLKYSIMILDACRNNPFTESWSRSVSNDGLASMAAKGTFIGFAATPGKTASDGEKRNGVYTEGILKFITVPDLTIDKIFTEVNGYVAKSTEGKQQPFKNSSFTTDYCFSVSRRVKSQIDLKKSTFIQPSSNLAISNDEQYLFTANSNTGEINIRDAKTTNIISTLASVGKPTSISIRNKQWLYCIDSINRAVDIFDAEAQKLSTQLKLDYIPNDLVSSVDNRNLYVSGNIKGSGYISFIDALSGKIIKNLSVKSGVSKMIISPDGKYLYLSSKLPTGTLTIVDVKAQKIKKEVNDIFIGSSIGITPDNQKLYTSNLDKRKIDIIDVNTLKIIKSIVGDAISFAFTKDSKYVFAVNNSKILMIDSHDNEIIKSLPFVTPPGGLTFSSDGTGFVWLPEEKIVSIFSVQDQSKNAKVEIDPELNLSKFKEEINNDPSVIETIRKGELCGKLSSFFGRLYEIGIRSVVSGLNYELSKGVKYKLNGSFDIVTDCEKFTGKASLGIVSVSDPKKTICPNFNLKKLGYEVTIEVKDGHIDLEAKSFKFYVNESKNANTPLPSLYLPVNDTDLKALQKFVRDYFSRRIDYLR